MICGKLHNKRSGFAGKGLEFLQQNAGKDDIIVLAGKGHETYQEIKGIRYEMDDRKLINEIIRETEDKNRH